jgi:thioredoxin 1
MGQPVTVSDATFEAEVVNSSTPVLVDFWAPWCGPCRVVGPILDEIAQEQEGALKIAKVNVDENHGVASQLGISSIPTMILYKDGQAVEKIIGAQPKNRILQAISQHVN